MRILITGSNGFVGKNLYYFLKSKKKYEIYEFNRKDNFKKLEKLVHLVDVIFHCAGENRSKKKKTLKFQI